MTENAFSEIERPQAAIARGTGIGTRRLRAIMTEARRRALDEVRLDVIDTEGALRTRRIHGNGA